MSTARPFSSYEGLVEVCRARAAEGNYFFAEASDYESLKAALRARVEQLNVSRNCLDSVAGFCTGYAAKLLAPYSRKKIGQLSLGLLLKTAGMKMVIVDDAEAAKRNKGKARSVDIDGLLRAAGLKMILVEDRDALAKVQPRLEVRTSNAVRLNNMSRKNKGRRTSRSSAPRSADASAA